MSPAGDSLAACGRPGVRWQRVGYHCSGGTSSSYARLRLPRPSSEGHQDNATVLCRFRGTQTMDDLEASKCPTAVPVGGLGVLSTLRLCSVVRRRRRRLYSHF
ncbi:hypothetical protein NHX12_010981 [Muraenolepis orangiensis]|uniref:Uncharacterized protein n=1 Tax=Muraenolepis orangiensis TaxID=630683 RepID=A0A9Q0I772_9TELE|nr:hypothetical protein NHX12_010981 [Muraenolepis orangiensis]